jgi:hypothetical protein
MAFLVGMGGRLLAVGTLADAHRHRVHLMLRGQAVRPTPSVYTGAAGKLFLDES